MDNRERLHVAGGALGRLGGVLAIAIAMLTLAGTSVAAAETTEWQEYSRESWRVLTVPTAAEWTGKITFV